MTDLTPNLGLEKIPANTKVWTDRANTNWTLIDAAIGAYFTLQNLQGIWENSHAYTVNQTVVDDETAAVWVAQVDHTSMGIPSTFAEERAANPTYWTTYSSPARARGAWTGPGTTYGVNDFVVSGAKYAVCIAAHVSGAIFAVDEALGYWSILIDLSAAGSTVLPVPGGAADANKVVVTPSTGTGYTIISMSDLLTLLGASTVGRAVFAAASATAGRSALNAQVSGSYQTASAALEELSDATIVDFGKALLAIANAAALRSAAALGTAAVLDAGTSVNNLVQMATGPKLPAVDGSALTNLTGANIITPPFPDVDYDEVYLSGNVVLGSAAFIDGPTIALGIGTWLVQGKVTVTDGVAATIYGRLTDGTTVFDSTTTQIPTASGFSDVKLFGKIVLAAPATVKVQILDTGAAGGILYNTSGQGKDASIKAWRIA